MGVDVDVMNVWEGRSDDYLIVYCAMLHGLESGLLLSVYEGT